MKISRLLMTLGISAIIGFIGCSTPTDADIKAEIELKLKSKPEMSGTIVDVKNGIITLTGECKDDICKIDCEKIAQEVEGVKTVINHLAIAEAPPPPLSPLPPATLIPVVDSVTQLQVKDDLKKFKGITIEFEGEKAVLTGKVTKSEKKEIMQILSTAEVKSDVSKLIVKIDSKPKAKSKAKPKAKRKRR